MVYINIYQNFLISGYWSGKIQGIIEMAEKILIFFFFSENANSEQHFFKVLQKELVLRNLVADQKRRTKHLRDFFFDIFNMKNSAFLMQDIFCFTSQSRAALFQQYLIIVSYH